MLMVSMMRLVMPVGDAVGDDGRMTMVLMAKAMAMVMSRQWR